MKLFRAVAVALSFSLIAPAATQPHYRVTYSGGSLIGVKAGQTLRLYIDSDAIRLYGEHVKSRVRSQDDDAKLKLKLTAIAELRYGQDVAAQAFIKSKKYYVGLIWADGDNKGGIAFYPDKDEFRGILAALEGLTGKTAVNTDHPAK